MNNENRETCKRIAKELDKIADGTMYRCPECGEWISDDDGTTYDEIHDTITCNHCNAEFYYIDAEQISFLDYFGDCFNIEYRVNGNKEFKSVEIMVACGGPNIYVDTKSAVVRLHWWTDYAEYPISYGTRDAIDDAFNDLFNC